MYIQSFLPAPALAAYVEQYCLWDVVAAPEAAVAAPVLPEVASRLSICYSHPDESLTMAGREVPATPMVEVAGMLTTRRLSSRQAGHLGGLGIYFRPTGFFSLFGVPLSAAIDTAQQPESSAGQFARELGQRVSAAPTPATRLASAEALLLRRLRWVQPTSDAMAHVAAFIQAQHGRVSVEELAQVANLSRRQLERRFVAEVGTTPKLYARIARFNYVLRLLDQAAAPDWPGISYQCGFFDQAHFIREFRSFTGESPGHYVQHYHDDAHFFWAR
ncbi:helix-turn-helix transcriptional regulator [Hymenobacter elongatus]|uniref:Helix-turn-helix domain-containing protein n=1 Tax=Hymenobacter elongatus TaxID=877208 RepID=A0A4Z0PT90_9BACT|nr:helix-turn-helix transcriptional regulator [Hymenobacter elongatus]TGE20221.1 helix-turn-helix domain-containing protein [Hymenobacter elongatus]